MMRETVAVDTFANFATSRIVLMIWPPYLKVYNDVALLLFGVIIIYIVKNVNGN